MLTIEATGVRSRMSFSDAIIRIMPEHLDRALAHQAETRRCLDVVRGLVDLVLQDFVAAGIGIRNVELELDPLKRRRRFRGRRGNCDDRSHAGSGSAKQ